MKKTMKAKKMSSGGCMKSGGQVQNENMPKTMRLKGGCVTDKKKK